ncbi:MAG: M23 family metallopeptidase [Deltaproteobacteria bacterium]|nr:M23 family metallopeptidase [Deltaproteobacteria bacterium]
MIVALLLTTLAAPNTAVVDSTLPCSVIRSPFGSDRRSYKALHRRVISTFGADRQSYVRGHRHAGIDLRGRASEEVRPICPGKVVDLHLDFPHRTIVIEHRDSGRIFYSSYKHVEAPRVEVGDVVTEETPIARLFDEREKRGANFQVIHLHFEIRKSVEDGGTASWTSMTMGELTKYAEDPLKLFESTLAKRAR